MKNLIVNADDFGKDENASSAIMECLTKGYISQTTLMVNMPWTGKAVEMAKEAGFGNRLGLHITLTEGRPLTDAMSASPCFCKDGCFLRDAVLTRSWKPYAMSERRVLTDELEAQIRRYLDYGLPLLHCDGHHHAHNALPVYYVLIPLLKKYGFKSIRRTVSAPWNELLRPHVKAWAKDAVRAVLRDNGMMTVGRFGSCEYFKRNVSSFGSGDNVEVMVHPRYNSCGELVDFKTSDGLPMIDVAQELHAFKSAFSTYEDLK